MNISELESRTGITKQNIRFYEKKGLLHPQRNSGNNYREYTEGDVQTLLHIKVLRKLDISIEDILRVFQEEVSLGELIGTHLSELQQKQKELDASIEVCRSLRNTELKELDAERVLERMDELEKRGGTFRSILNDYKKVARAEEKKKFSFTPNTAVTNPGEFTMALCQYADENDLNLVITKEGMYPTFEIDGIEYMARREYRRIGMRGISMPVAVILCEMTHPMELDAEIADVTEERRRIFRFLYKYLAVLIVVVFLIFTRMDIALRMTWLVIFLVVVSGIAVYWHWRLK